MARISQTTLPEIEGEGQGQGHGQSPGHGGNGEHFCVQTRPLIWVRDAVAELLDRVGEGTKAIPRQDGYGLHGTIETMINELAATHSEVLGIKEQLDDLQQDVAEIKRALRSGTSLPPPKATRGEIVRGAGKWGAVAALGIGLAEAAQHLAPVLMRAIGGGP